MNEFITWIPQPRALFRATDIWLATLELRCHCDLRFTLFSFLAWFATLSLRALIPWFKREQVYSQLKRNSFMLCKSLARTKPNCSAFDYFFPNNFRKNCHTKVNFIPFESVKNYLSITVRVITPWFFSFYARLRHVHH